VIDDAGRLREPLAALVLDAGPDELARHAKPSSRVLLTSLVAWKPFATASPNRSRRGHRSGLR
jgi:hypothetical protein